MELGELAKQLCAEIKWSNGYLSSPIVDIGCSGMHPF